MAVSHPDRPGAAKMVAEKTEALLRDILAKEIGLSAESIQADVAFDQYGVDSVMVTGVVRELEKHFGGLPKTLLFEYQNLQQLTEYFLENHDGRLSEMFGSRATIETAVETRPAERIEVRAGRTERRRFFADASRRAEAFATDEIAIIGISGRYPAAKNLEAFCHNLRTGGDGVTEIPADRWDYRLDYDADKHKRGKTYSKWGGFIDDVDKFDPLFFNISPKEAELMDPQERLFLETAWHTLEDAGYAGIRLNSRSVGVFVGVMYGHYQLYGAEISLTGEKIALDSSFASVANRVSYYFDFHGPSLAVDTMCSSSLTAIHLACESIRRGECEMALAGGVNLTIHPNKYILLSQGRFASSDGRCRSFGRGGDGYVPGEGVGAVLLKPLGRAIQDEDRIYAVIKGSAVNHGGKTNGYTVPSPNAQAELILEACQRAKISPRTITYLEAHGTGTSLGDPIEIAGLAKAFARYTQDRQFCAIGSVKSNIGHLESAAGIAGITRVLLQMRERRLFPSLHSERLNENIPFEDTAFYVQHELAEWERPVVAEDGGERVYPRRAGISSFGAGGANAHLILEEYSGDHPEPAGVESSSQLVVLSARTEERLQVYAREMASFLQRALENKASEGTVTLDNVAYTLQVGRRAMEYRLALVVSSIDELIAGLSSYGNGLQKTAHLYLGRNRHDHSYSQLLEGDKAGEVFLQALLQQRDFSRLAKLWVDGVALDWRLLYGNNRPRLISLPMYPFLAERCWIDRNNAGGFGVGERKVSALHPLVDDNVSTLHEQAYEKRFSGDEYYLAGHLVQGEQTLPGAVCLEMIRAAGALANQGTPVKRIKAIKWLKPLRIGKEGRTLHLTLHPRQGREVELAVTAQGEEKQIYLQGLLEYEDSSHTAAPTEPLDLSLVKERCGVLKEREECYDLLEKCGVNYGPSLQVIKELYCGEGEALALVELAGEPWSFGRNPFVLRPPILDGAFQTVVGLLGSIGASDGRVFLPASLDEFTFSGSLPDRAYVHARLAEATTAEVRFHLKLVAEDGAQLAELKGLSFKAVPHHHRSRHDGPLFYRPIWESSPAVPAGHQPATPRSILVMAADGELAADLRRRTERDQGKVILVRPGDQYRESDSFSYQINPGGQEDYIRLLSSLRERGMLPSHIVYSALGRPSTGGRKPADGPMDETVYSLLLLAKALMRQAAGAHLLFLYGDEEPARRPFYAGVSGFLKTLCLEDPKHTGAVVEVSGAPEGSLADLVLDELGRPKSPVLEVQYRGGLRLVKGVQELEPGQPAAGGTLWRKNGVYLISGGAGGLGLIFGRHLAKECHARLVLIGRSSLDAERRKKMESIQDLGGQALYIAADIAKRSEIERAIGQAKEKYGEINGVIHSAGVLRDSLIYRKTREEMRAVLASKVDGTIWLDELTAQEPLDFFALFSSSAAMTGNIGQADYAYANSFMDNYLLWREGQGRPGKSLAINWPLWRDGGMNPGEEAIAAMAEATGIRPLATEEGITAFEDALKHDRGQLLVLAGEVSRVKETVRKIFPTAPKQAAAEPPARGPLVEERLREEIEAYLRRLLAAELKIPLHRVDVNEPLEAYGLDSVVIMDLLRELEGIFGRLPKALFFEYRSLAELAGYFLSHHEARLWQMLEGQGEATGTPACERSWLEASPAKEEQEPKWRSTIGREWRDSGRARGSEAMEIAVIGLSGRFPMAENAEAFWENLKAGKDCIQEIPAERWEYERFYDQEKGKRGKTYSKWGGFISDVDKFDPLFFNIPPIEAQRMDPQERIFLETAWRALEDAGYNRTGLDGARVGVYVGVMYSHYQFFGAEEALAGRAVAGNSSYASIANRVSYFFNFHGPSLALDTMCSSSLVAIHLACQSLHSGESEMAIAGGVNLSIHPSKYIALSQSNFVSSDGRCRSFGANGDGYVPGEGVGAVILKPLQQAIRDRDQIYAVIKGTAINHGGRTNGYTVPNPTAQANLVTEALARAEIDPRTISYLEAHGTGTMLGDPIEIAGLTSAFANHTADRQFCAIGSVKSNIGHLESAAGVAGVIKVLLQMKYGLLVPSIHSERLNPQIDFEETPFFVQRTTERWDRPVMYEAGREKICPRRAGVSAFGAGGANAHIILEEYRHPPPSVRQAGIGRQLIVLSAKNEESLRICASQLREFIARVVSSRADGEDLSSTLESLAFTLQVGREEMDVRLAMVVSTLEELSAKLLGYLSGERTGHYTGQVKGGERSDRKPVSREVGPESIESLCRECAWEQLAQLWVAGTAIGWRRLSRSEDCRRISLPGYPLARIRCWIEAPASPGYLLDGREENTPSPPASEDSLLYLAEEWRESPFSTDAGIYRPHTVLVFSSGGDLSLAVRKKLHGHARIVQVVPARAYRASEESYQIDPAAGDDYRELVADLKSRGSFPDLILHLWSQEDVPADQADLDHDLERGFYSLFFLIKELGRQGVAENTRLLYVYCTQGGLVRPAAAGIGGFIRTAALENPGLSLKTINIDGRLAAGDPLVERYADLLLQEVMAEERGHGTEIKYHLGNRYVMALREMDLPEAAGIPVRAGGVYLVTGGAGGLGLLLAEHILGKTAAKLILTGRSAPNSAISQRLRELSGRGAEVIYRQSDITQPAAIEKLVEEIKARFGRINGVFQCAGVHSHRLITQKTQIELKKVLSPKVHGTVWLDEALKDEDLDFFVLFSSLAGISGKAGHCDYAYGNSFLDKFAAERERLRALGLRKGRTVSVDWPYWRDGGMQLAKEERLGLAEEAGIKPLPSAEGFRALAAALHSAEPHCAVIYGVPRKIRSYLDRMWVEPSLEKAASPDSAWLYAGAEKLLRKLLAEEIGLAPEELDVRAGFDEYGIDSIIIGRFNDKMQSILGSLPNTLLLEYHNLADLAAHVAKTCAPQLRQVLGPRGESDSVRETTRAPERRTLSGRVEVSPSGRSAEDTGDGEIAVIGMGGRYPAAPNLEQFWHNLKTGKDCIAEIPEERWDSRLFYHPDPELADEGRMYCKWGGFLRDADRFDPLFFNISPREAEMMDPQERIFLETAWEALEDAGYTRSQMQSYIKNNHGANVGVFVGVTSNTYQMLGPEQWAKGNMVVPTSMSWSIANRVSYLFNFSGPSLALDTACSSGLMVIHMACDSLRKGECLMAIAGGVNLYLHPSKYISLCQMRMLSPTGRCHSFGRPGDGFVPGEGVGAFLLKPLKEAEKDGDHIYAVIKGSAINHGGRTAGYSVPNPGAQSAVIREALRKSGVAPRTISYLEAHGTGTALGDPLEIRGLMAAFAEEAKQFCAIGSVKSNIGHLEAAAGIAGLTKVILQMQHQELVPSINSEQLNPDIDFLASCFYLQHEPAFWEQPTVLENGTEKRYPRRAGVSSFGAGGVNAHVILEEYRGRADEAPTPQTEVVILSAKSEDRLRTYAGIMADFLSDRTKRAIAPKTSDDLYARLWNRLELAAADGDLSPEGMFDRYQRVFDQLHQYAYTLLLATCQKMGLFTTSGEHYHRTQLKEAIRLVPAYDRFLDILLEILARQGYISITGEEISVTSLIEQEEVKERMLNKERIGDELWAEYPEFRPHLRLLRVCIENYPRLLTGQVNHIDILYPGGSMELVDRIFYGNPVVDYYNKLVAILVRLYVEERLWEDPSAVVRILEVGAGTGGTSRFVLRQLREYAASIRYYYTDVSAGFSQYGKKTFGRDYGFADFAVLDLETDPEKQGFTSGSMDLIFASNVIHATKSVAESLKNIGKLLSDRGLVVINEITSVLDFSSLTFGLTTGWSLYETRRIKNSPLLSPEMWREELGRSGFGRVRLLGLPGKLSEDSMQNIIVAQKPPRAGDGAESIRLADLAYTLQIGREALEERLALPVSSIEEAIEKLRRFGGDGTLMSGVYRGRAGRRKQLSELKAAETEEDGAHRWARLWVEGLEVDWLGLRGTSRPRRISLPTYPFMRERFWVPSRDEKAGIADAPPCDTMDNLGADEAIKSLLRKLENDELEVAEAEKLMGEILGG